MLTYPEIPEWVENADEGLHWTTVSLLAILNLEWMFLFFAFGPIRFFTHWEYVVDMALVLAALVITITFHEAELDESAEIIAELVLLILRLFRLMHAISTIVEERKEEKIEKLKEEIEQLKEKLKEL